MTCPTCQTEMTEAYGRMICREPHDAALFARLYIDASPIALDSAATYHCREEIKRVGGKFDGRQWSVTAAQLAHLRELARESGERSNKRDTQFSRDWAAVEATLVGEEA